MKNSIIFIDTKIRYYYNILKTKFTRGKIMENTYEKYMSARRIFNYNLCLSKAKNVDGTINETKLNELLMQNYNNIKNSFEKRMKQNDSLDKKLNAEVSELNKLYLLINNENVRNQNNELVKEEEYAKKLPIDSNIIEPGIIKNLNYIPLNENKYNFKVYPENENPKHITVITKRKYEYFTKLGIRAFINYIDITKNLNGVEMNFKVFTNTNFENIYKLINIKKELTNNEKAYIQLFYNQMSDIHLMSCYRKFDGYIGSIEYNFDKPLFEMNSEDYALTKRVKSDLK